jgi:hypothetical protein
MMAQKCFKTLLSVGVVYKTTVLNALATGMFRRYSLHALNSVFALAILFHQIPFILLITNAKGCLTSVSRSSCARTAILTMPEIPYMSRLPIAAGLQMRPGSILGGRDDKDQKSDSS